MCSFLIRVAAGEYEVDAREDLVKLLSGIARKKLALLMRRESAQCRDRRRCPPLLARDFPFSAGAAPCNRAVAHHFFLHRLSGQSVFRP